MTWGRSHGGFFRPLFILSYFVDVKIWGLNPLGFHLTNLTFHALNSFLVSLLAARLTADAPLSLGAQRSLPLAAALIFLLHPSHTEAVSWISGRADLVATLFCLLSLLAYETFTRTRGTKSLLLSLALFASALLAKEAAICLPLVVILLGVYLVKSRGGGAARTFVIRPAAFFIFIALLYVALRAWMLGALVGGYGQSQHLNFTHSTIINQLLRFTLRINFPTVILESATFLESRALSPVLIAFGVIVVIVTVAALARRTMRRWLLERAKRNLLLWLLLTLSICCFLSAINLRVNVFDTQGERYLYLPSAFFSIALVYLLAKMMTRERL